MPIRRSYGSELLGLTGRPTSASSGHSAITSIISRTVSITRLASASSKSSTQKPCEMAWRYAPRSSRWLYSSFERRPWWIAWMRTPVPRKMRASDMPSAASDSLAPASSADHARSSAASGSPVARAFSACAIRRKTAGPVHGRVPSGACSRSGSPDHHQLEAPALLRFDPLRQFADLRNRTQCVARLHFDDLGLAVLSHDQVGAEAIHEIERFLERNVVALAPVLGPLSCGARGTPFRLRCRSP